MAAPPARRRSESPRASASRRRSASASSRGTPDGFDGTSPAHFSCSCAAAGTVVHRRQEAGLPEVLGGVEAQLLLAQRQEDEGAEQLCVVDAGDGVACRRQGGSSGPRLRRGSDSSPPQSGCRRPGAARRDSAVARRRRGPAARWRRPRSPLWRKRAPSRRGSSQARRHHQDRRPCQAQHPVGRQSRVAARAGRHRGGRP